MCPHTANETFLNGLLTVFRLASTNHNSERLKLLLNQAENWIRSQCLKWVGSESEKEVRKCTICHMMKTHRNMLEFNGASGRTRTCNLLIRSYASRVAECARAFQQVNAERSFAKASAKTATSCSREAHGAKKRITILLFILLHRRALLSAIVDCLLEC